jgi:multidrug resistance efflux pump
LASIHEGDPARIKLMGSTKAIRGHVDSVARGIEVSNAQPDAAGLAKVNPIFTWVRLAQRVPVRIHLDEHPEDVPLVAGMTATVETDRSRQQRPLGDGTANQGMIKKLGDYINVIWAAIAASGR